MIVKELMQVIANLRFKVYIKGTDQKTSMTIKDISSLLNATNIIEIYKLNNEIGFEYELLKTFKDGEYLKFLHDEETMNMEVAKECDISILPYCLVSSSFGKEDITGGLLKIYVK